MGTPLQQTGGYLSTLSGGSSLLLRFVVPLFLIFVGSMFAVWPSFALEGDVGKIESSSKNVRIRIAELDQQLQTHLREAVEKFGDRQIECGKSAEKKPLSDCIAEDGDDLTQTRLSIARTKDGDVKDGPLDELAATEERFAMFIERMNKTNDLLSRAGATMYRTSFDITPEMDQLRRQVIAYVERKQEYDLRLNQAMLIAGVTLVLIAIFAMIFFATRRIRGN
ncbi:hypothetical protein SAMN02744133_10255 [Thalassospira xiamenensis M-5 = DSM 17429]|nr:hypothetical protein SAMN02744133_10255 [Thalassospira xiamenensis M-5 = DSM 17429]